MYEMHLLSEMSTLPNWPPQENHGVLNIFNKIILPFLRVTYSSINPHYQKQSFALQRTIAVLIRAGQGGGQRGQFAPGFGGPPIIFNSFLGAKYHLWPEIFVGKICKKSHESDEHMFVRKIYWQNTCLSAKFLT